MTGLIKGNDWIMVNTKTAALIKKKYHKVKKKKKKDSAVSYKVI